MAATIIENERPERPLGGFISIVIWIDLLLLLVNNEHRLELLMVGLLCAEILN